MSVYAGELFLSLRFLSLSCESAGVKQELLSAAHLFQNIYFLCYNKGIVCDLLMNGVVILIERRVNHDRRKDH